MHRLLNKVLVFIATIIFTFSFLLGSVYAQCPGTTTAEQIKCGANAGAGESGSNDPKKLDSTIESGLNVFSVIIGVVAVVMIMFGGLRYITSAGDTTKVANAKNTILYAAIGLVVVALAQVIVRFVLSTATDTTPPPKSKSSSQPNTTPPPSSGGIKPGTQPD
ncbi:hypothetical protein H0X09_00050 [Candidatus Saccharibacteria bacterium]|nr:hypothetical protein [Candidatus Saccharibacteria bacterium]